MYALWKDPSRVGLQYQEVNRLTDKCPHFGNWNTPPPDIDCINCDDINRCCLEVAKRLREEGGPKGLAKVYEGVVKLRMKVKPR